MKSVEKVPTLASRLQEAIYERNMKQIDLTVLTGISRGAISSYLSGRWKPKQNNIYLLAKALNVSEAWLLGYDVPMTRVHEHYKNNSPMVDLPLFEYDHYPVGISAGCLFEIEPTELNKVSIPDILLGKYARNKKLCVMHVNGESMNNIINDGAVIGVLRDIKPSVIHNGDIVVISNDHGEYTVKRFYNDVENRRIILRPDSNNPIFTDQIYSYDEDVKIFGKVVIYSVIL